MAPGKPSPPGRPAGEYGRTQSRDRQQKCSAACLRAGGRSSTVEHRRRAGERARLLGSRQLQLQFQLQAGDAHLWTTASKRDTAFPGLRRSASSLHNCHRGISLWRDLRHERYFVNLRGSPRLQSCRQTARSVGVGLADVPDTRRQSLGGGAGCFCHNCSVNVGKRAAGTSSRGSDRAAGILDPCVSAPERSVTPRGVRNEDQGRATSEHDPVTEIPEYSTFRGVRRADATAQPTPEEFCCDSAKQLHVIRETVCRMISDRGLLACDEKLTVEIADSLLKAVPAQTLQERREPDGEVTAEEIGEERAGKIRGSPGTYSADISGEYFSSDLGKLVENCTCGRKFAGQNAHDESLCIIDVLRTIFFNLASGKNSLCNQCGGTVNKSNKIKFTKPGGKSVNGEGECLHSDEKSIQEIGDVGHKQITNNIVPAIKAKLPTACYAADLGKVSANFVADNRNNFGDKYVYFATAKSKVKNESCVDGVRKKSSEDVTDASNGASEGRAKYETNDLLGGKITSNLRTRNDNSVTSGQSLNASGTNESSNEILHVNEITVGNFLECCSLREGEIHTQEAAHICARQNHEENCQHKFSETTSMEDAVCPADTNPGNTTEENDNENIDLNNIATNIINRVQQTTKLLESRNKRETYQANNDESHNARIRKVVEKSSLGVENVSPTVNRNAAKASVKGGSKKRKVRNTYWDKFIESDVHSVDRKNSSCKHSGTSKKSRLRAKHFEVVTLTTFNARTNTSVPTSKIVPEVEELPEEETVFSGNVVSETPKRQKKSASEVDVSVSPGSTVGRGSETGSSKSHRLLAPSSISRDQSKQRESKRTKEDAVPEFAGTLPGTSDVRLSEGNATWTPARGSSSTGGRGGEEAFPLDSGADVTFASTKSWSGIPEVDESARAVVKSNSKRRISSCTKISVDVDVQTESSRKGKDGSRKSSQEVRLSSAVCSSVITLNSSLSLHRTSSRLAVSRQSSTSELRTAGVLHYRMSDPRYLELGWSVIPSESVVARVRTFSARPARLTSVWAALPPSSCYRDGRALCVVDEQARRATWLYPGGDLAAALDASRAPCTLVVFARDDHPPPSLLARFDSLGNGAVYDGARGSAMLRFNQRGGVLREPAMRWAWRGMVDVGDPLEEVTCEHRGLDDPHLRDPRALCGSKAYRRAAARARQQQQAAVARGSRARNTRASLLRRRSSACVVDDEAAPEQKEEEHDGRREARCKRPARTSSYTPIKPILLKLNEHFVLRLADQRSVSLEFHVDGRARRLELGVLVDPAAVDHEDLLAPELLERYTRDCCAVDSLV